MLAPVGRTVGAIAGGVAEGTIATSVGAPPSAGGLGVVLSAGVATGAHAFLFEDGPWISTMAPAMFPLDQPSIIGGEPGEAVPDPLGIVDLELEDESVFIPAPDDPMLGSAYAIPLDGSSPTVDLLRSESAPATRAVFAAPIDPATFVASGLHARAAGRRRERRARARRARVEHRAAVRRRREPRVARPHAGGRDRQPRRPARRRA